MPINLYKIKKWGALFLMGFLPTFLFFLFLLFGWGLFYAIIAWLVGIVVGILIFNLLTKHPVLQMLEGEGLLVLTIDSTGIIKPFICKVKPPFLEGDLEGKKVSSIFDRDTIFYMKKPEKASLRKLKKEEAKNLLGDNFKEDVDYYILKYRKEDATKITYGFEHFPVLIYNKNLETFLTKDALAQVETEGIIKHLVLYLKKKTEELTAIMRDFARYVIEMTKPKGLPFGFLGKWWFWVIVIFVIALLFLMFFPGLMESVQPAIQTAKESVKTVVQTR